MRQETQKDQTFEQPSDKKTSEEKPEQARAIDTYFVGPPGSEKEVTDTKIGQVGIKEFNPADTFDVKKKIGSIEEKEGAVATATVSATTLEGKEILATTALKETKEKMTDIQEVMDFFTFQQHIKLRLANLLINCTPLKKIEKH